MLIQADARTLPLRDGCVQCVVTSPPYWGLRDYGIVGQLGVQQTPEAYVSDLADVFDEVRRVLRADGVCFVNLGDTYQNAKRQAGGVDPKQRHRRHGLRPQDVGVPGLKPKDLVGIPWMFAFEARRRGWYLRSDIVWAKPNPMCEPVEDRPTHAHEYVFLLSKARQYFWDAEAVKEQGVIPAGTRGAKGSAARKASGVNARPPEYKVYDGMRNLRSVWWIQARPFVDGHSATMPEALVTPCLLAGSRRGDIVFDPFMGSGTVGKVAERLGRRWVGVDLNPAYHRLAKQRTAQRGLRFENAVNE
jgi:DNA modification methylase